jgi:hypothetical protein
MAANAYAVGALAETGCACSSGYRLDFGCEKFHTDRPSYGENVVSIAVVEEISYFGAGQGLTHRVNNSKHEDRNDNNPSGTTVRCMHALSGV